MLTVGEVDASLRDAEMLEFEVVLTASLDGAGGEDVGVDSEVFAGRTTTSRYTCVHERLPTPALPGQVQAVGGRLPPSQPSVS